MFRDYTYDFGRDSKQEPKDVIRPTSTEEIRMALTSSAHHKIAIRGMAHCTGGQSLSKDGLVIDMKSYSKIGKIIVGDDGELLIEVQAGASWKEVFNHCLAQGLMPPTFADWLELTVGGPLSTGGVGQCSFKKGLQIDNVVSLEVMTVAGEMIRCSRKQNKELFDLVRGGLGQFGVITRVWIRLEKAPENVYVYKLIYSDLSAFLEAQTKLTNYEQIDAIQSHIVMAQKEVVDRIVGTVIPQDVYKKLPHQSQYFVLEVTKYINDATPLEEFKDFLISVTRHDPSFVFARTAKFVQHVNRVPPLLANPLEKNHPKHNHCCFFISANKASQLLSEVFAEPDHCEAMGYGTILVIPVKRSLIHAPYFMLPETENVFFVGILRRHVEPCHFDKLIRLNEHTYEKVERFGGKIYPVGSGSFLAKPTFWQKHYEKKYEAILKGKMIFDPEDRLTPNVKLRSSL